MCLVKWFKRVGTIAVNCDVFLWRCNFLYNVTFFDRFTRKIRKVFCNVNHLEGIIAWICIYPAIYLQTIMFDHSISVWAIRLFTCFLYDNTCNYGNWPWLLIFSGNVACFGLMFMDETSAYPDHTLLHIDKHTQGKHLLLLLNWLCTINCFTKYRSYACL